MTGSESFCCRGDSCGNDVEIGNSGVVELALVWCKVYMALDYMRYARWIQVHLRDMAELPHQRPEISDRFKAGHFTVQTSSRAFSAFPLDQAHKQSNTRAKGVVGFRDNPSAGWSPVPRWLGLSWSLRRTCIQLPITHATMQKSKCIESICQRCSIT